jgi:hypothetical protein
MLNGIGRYSNTFSREGGRGIQTLASTMDTINNGNASVTSRTSFSGSGIYDKDILDGFISDDPATIRRIAQNIYFFDPIAGQAVDMVCDLPYSDFELSGLPDQKMLKIYADNCNNIDIKTALPIITRGYLVNGVFVGTVTEDKQDNLFTAIMPHDLSLCTITYMPFANRDPIIDVAVPESLKQLFRSKDKRISSELERYGSTVKDMLSKRMYQLDPKFTLYFPRKTLPTTMEGTSYYKRIIPIWLIEKALIKGTIDLAHRRQKSILHLKIGDEEWIPSEQQMAQYVDLIRRADADPIGAIIATRPQIEANELGGGTNSFWQASEAESYTTSMKLRGLGITEDILGGNITLDTTSSAVTVFLDNMRSFRELVTRKILYNKLFLLIAIQHDFKVKEGKEQVTGEMGRVLNLSKDEYNEMMSSETITSDNMVVALDNERYKTSDYYMPRVQWHKPLRPEGNSEIMTSLATLEEKGLPIALKIWAASAGVSIAEVVRAWPEDEILRKRAAEFKARLPQPPAAADQGSSLLGVLSGMNRKRNRDFSNIEDPITKKLSAKGKKIYNEKTNKVIAEAIKRFNETENRKIKVEQRRDNKHYLMKSPIFGELK